MKWVILNLQPETGILSMNNQMQIIAQGMKSCSTEVLKSIIIF